MSDYILIFTMLAQCFLSTWLLGKWQHEQKRADAYKAMLDLDKFFSNVERVIGVKHPEEFKKAFEKERQVN